MLYLVYIYKVFLLFIISHEEKLFTKIYNQNSGQFKIKCKEL